MRRWAAAVLAGLLVTACTSDSTTRESRPTPGPTPRAGGRVVFGVLGEPPTLDPFGRRATDLTWAAVRPLYPSLYRFRPDGTPEPYLAESVAPEGDGVRVVLADMNWSNGEQITADDVVSSIERARPPSGFALVTAARAEDDRTVTLRGHVTEWERTLATLGFVMPDGRAQKVGGVFGGPLTLTRSVPGLELVYRRNPEWAGDLYIDRLKLQFVANLDFLMDLVEKSRLDAALLPSSVNIDERLDERGIGYATKLGWERVYLDFSGSGLGGRERAAFVDGIDRGAIADAFVRDDGRVSDTLYPAPGPDDVAPGRFDRGPGRTAKPSGEILATAPAGDELLTFVLRIMQQQLHGRIDLELAIGEVSAVYGGGRGDPGGVLVRRAAGIPGATDPPGAVRRLRAWPLFQVETVVALAPGLNGVEVNPTIEGPLWNVEDWWLSE
jgi:hypothetical protein